MDCIVDIKNMKHFFSLKMFSARNYFKDMLLCELPSPRRIEDEHHAFRIPRSIIGIAESQNRVTSFPLVPRHQTAFFGLQFTHVRMKAVVDHRANLHSSETGVEVPVTVLCSCPCFMQSVA